MTAPELPTAYATVDELQSYWRPLSEAEKARATFLLQRAALRINELPGSKDFNPATCNDISLDMVKRAMLGGGGVKSESQAMADMSTTQSYVNPVGNLYITGDETARLYGYAPAAFSLTPASNAHVPHQSWNWQPHWQHGGQHGTTAS
ncbi:hypothetical protein SEA_NAIRB_10 [Mycobacterium phage Nairb]|uniref:Head-to-tail adaptor n=5 Tax=Bernalvirus bernal13 TaxID=1982102 RepID=A0A2P1JRM0_9CAUD|nr:hypothetical protein FH37_gp10 [Mycobacterium phage Bernal13]AIT13423.1 hypothetical protein PBI_RONRAYGUN_10 [Mycobacterium phage RonRayGun]ASJ79091.1 head-to-tail adaptor [Mycobacterium phage ZenTime222]AVO21798.1 hypothetical protein SEA_NAIRB_10 [Mycobacterium phage Nairb]QBP28855.1 head-to-tail adaptor [Mycobacterium phage Ibrahim]QHB47416.1 head-to-tail adaptor [Mycobacterium phage Whitty]